MRKLEGQRRKWTALAAVFGLAVLAWFTMDSGGTEQAKLAWFVVDAGKIRAAAVLIVLSFAARILLMDRLSGRKPGDLEELESAAEKDAEGQS